MLVFSLVNTAEQFCGVNFTSTTYSVDASHTETQSTLYLWYLCFCNLFVGRLDITYRNEFVHFINRFNSLKVYITRPNWLRPNMCHPFKSRNATGMLRARASIDCIVKMHLSKYGPRISYWIEWLAYNNHSRMSFLNLHHADLPPVPRLIINSIVLC